MTGTQTVRRTTTRARRGGSMQLLRGLGAAMLTTIIVVAIFALLMQWMKPTEDTVRIFNQLLKVVSVAIGTYIAVGRGQEGVPVIGQFPSFRFGKEDMPRVQALFLYPLHAEDVQRVRIRAGEHRCAVRLTGDAAAIAEDIRI